MKKIIIAALLALMSFGTCGFAETGKLFTVSVSGNQLTITPTANHYYPSMGIKMSSKHKARGCTPSSNGYCLFAASPSSPAKISLVGADADVNATVCLNGDAEYSCQSVKKVLHACRTGGSCRVFVTSQAVQGDIGLSQFGYPGSTGIDRGNFICKKLAAEAGLPGDFRVWLSSTVTNAKDNILYDGTVTYVRAATPAVVIAAPGTLLTTTGILSLENAIGLDEYGPPPSLPYASALVWSSTKADGNYLPPPRKIIIVRTGVTTSSKQLLMGLSHFLTQLPHHGPKPIILPVVMIIYIYIVSRPHPQYDRRRFLSRAMKSVRATRIKTKKFRLASHPAPFLALIPKPPCGLLIKL